ncbi:KEOPS complex subunit Kae1/Bud32 [Natronomonas pharaonis DSM 2160]|uniref:Probable bifunctional tRNA threonylcarbamoyladenosine biosynthesis protein n=1 Tax=Natronomonas pharaonis (strain ATCC 35678 / DSM 2160 / CIP 103997 / JCM 8858 / NBRC 14720 / NCIMB 2260 / Gabara) TaxID=348780 RepID=KAE1B_NATPD|nr:bifunctional N(6)-L-threonylcarbamoyladenine synthase/serine/threonine protein kinase [Natronomonas pharaonis]Q3IMN2.1 RecName: Full=Probable bifunctional tRNA threonylcarbamoyladenosine biosynthesis protein; Includes: RecName: Full=tRNA N6-adenosine threonylcarbamoyltransferase; AltName: Full=N6-L-threonylcarbamoyladenine synthase; Short=t(6)A synthase; AltName: Full=t(6)A37 threonylcarbamoyladenosine biosynthesis protein Kae1; AltName: Full=tRNA threonylcarbamoyladenosine biosynthesis protein
MTRVLGIEGTAWCASAAVFDAETDAVFIDSDAYVPESGGIHPREAAEHMREAVPSVVEAALDHVESNWGDPADAIDAVAFSRGPGLGPCLRIAGTAARSLAGTLSCPLVGVNHMVAHLEIGRHRSGFESPVCLNASGANAHVLGYHNGRYRVLGETMDTGVGNAIDKFTRHVGWSHPGGPKVESHAEDGDYVELPYVVKGMDFSFSGIMSAAKQAYDDGTPVADVCCGLQETIFAMLAEVSERALSLTGADELVVGGGVAQNSRLQEMLTQMCENRGAAIYVPEPRFLRDNAGMIAVLGAKMYEAGDIISIPESGVRPDFRPDEVPVSWRDDEAVARPVPTDERRQGAEAVVDIDADGGRVTKRRLEKAYRHPVLDSRLRSQRTRSEARLTSEARRQGVPTPVVYDVDPDAGRLVFQYVGDADLKTALSESAVRDVGRHLAACHAAGFVHGDPTPRNVRVGEDRAFLIDFGLGYYTDAVEDYAMDLHVFEGALGGTADDPTAQITAFEDAYRSAGDGAVVDHLREIETRGRYQ